MADRGRKKRRTKRRDSTTHVKPPLDFIESPVDGRKYYCAPVQAARRPFLASSLPVDDAEAMKWVSPQFPNHVESGESLLTLLEARKKPRGRRKRQEDLQGRSKKSSSNKQPFAVLQFQSENQASRSKCTENRKEISYRRSQRLKLKELKRTHFLFETPQVTTPVSKKQEIVLAYETPDHDLIMLATGRQSKTKRGWIKD